MKEAENVFLNSESLLKSNFCLGSYKALFYYYYGKFLVHGIFYSGYSPNKALETLEKGENVIDKDQDQEIYSRLLDQKGMGVYFSEMSKKDPDYSLAKKILEKALEIRKKLNNLQMISETTFRLGLIEERLGNIAEALAKYTDSYEIAKDNNFIVEQSYTSRHLGFLHYRNQKYEEALNCLLESRDLRAKTGWKPGLIFSNISVGDVFTELNRYEEAKAVLEEAYKDAKEFGIKRGTLLCSLNFGILFKALNDMKTSISYFEEAKTIAEDLGHEIGLEMAEKNLTELKKQT